MSNYSYSTDSALTANQLFCGGPIVWNSILQTIWRTDISIDSFFEVVIVYKDIL